MTKVTKLTIATDIVNSTEGKDKAIQAIMERLEVSKANAYVYWTKVVKNNNKEVIVSDTNRKVNPITGTTPQQHDIKVLEIDNVIAGLRQKGIIQSPFPVI